MKAKKRAYVAARFDRKQEVREIYEHLKRIGYEIIDWTNHKQIKPYENNTTKARQYSSEDIKGIAHCDLFILLTDKAGTGMYAELGAAIFSNIEHGKPHIYVIGNSLSNCMFYFHPSVYRRKTIDDVIEEIK